jgi:hypothetical protein
LKLRNFRPLVLNPLFLINKGLFFIIEWGLFVSWLDRAWELLEVKEEDRAGDIQTKIH